MYIKFIVYWDELKTFLIFFRSICGVLEFFKYIKSYVNFREFGIKSKGGETNPKSGETNLKVGKRI